MDDLPRARAILSEMLACEFAGADAYRAQLEVAELRRHDTGCGLEVDRSRAPAGPFDLHSPGEALVEGFGPGKLWLALHAWEGYLDDLELLDAGRFPEVAQVPVRAWDAS